MTADERWARAALIAIVTNLPDDVRRQVMAGLDPLNRGRVMRALAEHETHRDGSEPS